MTDDEDFVWYLDGEDEKVFNDILKRNAREAMKLVADSLKNSFAYGRIESGKPIIRIVPHDDQCPEQWEFGAEAPLDGIISQMFRDNFARGSPNQPGHGIYLQDQAKAEPILKRFEEEIAQVRALYRGEKFDKNKWRK